MASRGFSSMVTTSVAATTAARSRTVGGNGASAAVISPASPTRSACSCGSSASARNAPARYSRGSLSPLITSMAIGSTPALGCGACDPRSVLIFGLGGLLEHTPAAVEPVRGDAVTQMRLTGLRITRQRGLRESIVRAVHAASRRGLAALLDGHVSAPENRILQL